MNEVGFQVLAGLPGTGPPALAFPASNRGFSEGFIVEVCPPAGDPWIGNFAYGFTGHNAVYHHPDGKRLIVIAGGQDYLIEPTTKRLVGETTSGISFSCELRTRQVIVFGNMIRFWAEGRQGRAWTTPRLSWDGFADIEVDGEVLTGKWYSAPYETWHEFRMDLATGKVAGPTFEAEFGQAIPLQSKSRS
jgi:hypothetical protein